MKTGKGHDYGFRWGSRRLMDLAELFVPALEEWARLEESEGANVSVMLYSHDPDECSHSIQVHPQHKTLRVAAEDPRWIAFNKKEPEPEKQAKPERLDLDQTRGVVHYPHNCGRCLSEDIMRGTVTGTYICSRCVVGLGVTFPTEPTVRLNGRTHLRSDFARVAAAQISTDVR